MLPMCCQDYTGLNSMLDAHYAQEDEINKNRRRAQGDANGQYGTCALRSSPAPVQTLGVSVAQSLDRAEFEPFVCFDQ